MFGGTLLVDKSTHNYSIVYLDHEMGYLAAGCRLDLYTSIVGLTACGLL